MMKRQEFQNLQRVAEIGDRFVSYVDQGQGDPVVLIHGIPTWGLLWSGLLPELARTRRVLIPDLLGFGYSDKADRFDRSIGKQAEALNSWMEKIGIESAAIIGHDIGGGVALRLATLFPNRVNTLCVLNSVCYNSWPIELMLQFGHPKAHEKLSAHAAIMVLKGALKAGFHKAPPDHLIEDLLAPYATEVGKLSLIRNAAALNTNLTAEITPLLPSVCVPTLILWGEDDKFQTIDYGRRLAWDIPGAKFISVRQARHFVMIDQPRKVRDALVDFLQVSTSTQKKAA